jgi:hypothetical protein
MYPILSNILFSRLTSNVQEITGDHQHGFWHNRSTTVHIFWICEILERKGVKMKQFIIFLWTCKKVNDSFRREVFYNTLMKFGVPMKVVRLTKMCLNELCSWVRVGKNLSDVFLIMNGFQQGDNSSPLLLNFVLEYPIRKFQLDQYGLKLKVHTNIWFMLMMLLYWVEAYLLHGKHSRFSSR